MITVGADTSLLLLAWHGLNKVALRWLVCALIIGTLVYWSMFMYQANPRHGLNAAPGHPLYGACPAVATPC